MVKEAIPCAHKKCMNGGNGGKKHIQCDNLLPNFLCSCGYVFCKKCLVAHKDADGKCELGKDFVAPQTKKYTLADLAYFSDSSDEEDDEGAEEEEEH
jgi:hypothetical protein